MQNGLFHSEAAENAMRTSCTYLRVYIVFTYELMERLDSVQLANKYTIQALKS